MLRCRDRGTHIISTSLSVPLSSAHAIERYNMARLKDLVAANDKFEGLTEQLGMGLGKRA